MTTTISKNTPINITIGALIIIAGCVWAIATYAAAVDVKIGDNTTEIKLIKQQQTNDSQRLQRIEQKLDKALGI